MKTWKVKSKGIIEKMIIFYFFLSFIIFCFLLWGAGKARISVWDLFSPDDIPTLIPILIPLIFVTFKKLISSKVPKEIQLDEQGGTLKITFSKKRHILIELNSVAYSHSETMRNHASITFYKTFIGTRGQQVYNEVIQIIALKWTLSWKIEQLRDVIRELELLDIEKRRSINERISLIDKIISN